MDDGGDQRGGGGGVPGLALCLASSFFGHYAHSGLLVALEEAGLVPERIAGSSGGAIAGGLFAAGLRGDDLLRLVTSFDFKRAFCDVGFLFRWPGVLTSTYGTGLLSGGRMRGFLRKRIGTLRIEDLRGPAVEFGVANLTDGRSEVVGEGDLVDFLVASYAMPVVFCAQRVAGKDYADGGVANETPFEQWLDDDRVRVIVLHTIRHTECEAKAPRTVGDVLSLSHRVVANELFERRRRLAVAAGKRWLHWETVHRHPGLIQGRRASEYVAAGRATVAAGLDGLRAELHACGAAGKTVGSAE